MTVPSETKKSLRSLRYCITIKVDVYKRQIPGAAAISMTLYEALSLALNSGGADSLELMPVSGIFIAFNSDDVIIDQNGDCYLAGPGIIFALEDGDIVSLDVEDKKLITQVLEDGTAELTNGAEIRCAFGL